MRLLRPFGARNDVKKLIKNIPTWIKKKVKDAFAKGIVVGVSGGVDSAVVAALCRKAVGRKNVLCLLLPCQTPASETKDAVLVCKLLKVNYRTIELTPTYEKLVRILPSADKKTLANIKPRLRMMTLYFFANKNNYLVAGTGNKSELTLGYFTKYGDGGVDVLPIGDLLKAEVKALARELGIPESIISKKPTAGLWQGQTDEGEMGLTYDYIDSILGRSKDGKITGSKKIREMALKARHKLFAPEKYEK